MNKIKSQSWTPAPALRAAIRISSIGLLWFFALVVTSTMPRAAVAQTQSCGGSGQSACAPPAATSCTIAGGGSTPTMCVRIAQLIAGVRRTAIFVVPIMLATASVSAADLPAASNIPVLEKTLSALSLNNPTKDLDFNLAHNDRRFVGIYGYTCDAPEVTDAEWKIIHSGKYGMRCLEGTGDVVEGSVHKALIGMAMKYAIAYNRELLNRIRAGQI